MANCLSLLNDALDGDSGALAEIANELGHGRLVAELFMAAEIDSTPGNEPDRLAVAADGLIDAMQANREGACRAGIIAAQSFSLRFECELTKLVRADNEWARQALTHAMNDVVNLAGVDLFDQAAVSDAVEASYDVHRDPANKGLIWLVRSVGFQDQLIEMAIHFTNHLLQHVARFGPRVEPQNVLVRLSSAYEYGKQLEQKTVGEARIRRLQIGDILRHKSREQLIADVRTEVSRKDLA